jgi:hypothetical protein
MKTINSLPPRQPFQPFGPSPAARRHGVVKVADDSRGPDQGGATVSEQSGPGPAPAALEGRVRILEERVSALADAIRVLARGLEDIPTIEPGQRRAADAARQAHELLLLVAEPRTPPAP